MADRIIDKRKRTWEARVEMSIYRAPGIGTYEKLVYSILCGFANKDGVAFPTVSKLAVMASCSDRQVRRALKNLEDNRLIVRRPQICLNGQIANIYELYGLSASAEQISTETAAADEETPEEIRTDSPGGMTDSHRGVTDSHRGVTDSQGGYDCQSGVISKQLHITAPYNVTSPDGFEKKTGASKAKKQNPLLDEWFEKFYLHYPRKCDKKKAHKAFMAIFSRASPALHREIMENLILRLTAYVAERKAAAENNPDANQYTKYPASWLNAHDFGDKPDESEILTEEIWE